MIKCIHLTIRIYYSFVFMNAIVTGPECSGKTTLVNDLSSVLKWPIVTEVAREYLYVRNGKYTELDLYEIALLQHFENNIIASNTEHYIADTDLLTILIWMEEKYKRYDHFIYELWLKSRKSLVLLCTPEMPWENDPLRENPIDRFRLLEVYKTWLCRHNIEYFIVKGNQIKRIEDVLKIIEIKNGKI